MLEFKHKDIKANTDKLIINFLGISLEANYNSIISEQAKDLKDPSLEVNDVAFNATSDFLSFKLINRAKYDLRFLSYDFFKIGC